MRHGDEQAQVMEWVYATLSEDPILAGLAGVQPAELPTRVWPDVAPADTQAPWLVYSVGEALDTLPVGPHSRIHATVPVNVRWITLAERSSTAAPAARRLYALLHGARSEPVADGGFILTCRRTTALSYPEDAGGIQYRHTGGLFVAEVN
jgi:hypothetical protein